VLRVSWVQLPAPDMPLKDLFTRKKNPAPGGEMPTRAHTYSCAHIHALTHTHTFTWTRDACGRIFAAAADAAVVVVVDTTDSCLSTAHV